MQSMTRCPTCLGEGHFAAFVDRADGKGTFEPRVRCPSCDGEGTVPTLQGEWMLRGTIHRKARVARGESLMDAAKRLGIPPAELNAMEHGRQDPVPLDPP